MGSGLNSKKLSRPVRTLCTIPAFSNTRRCFVIACRVSLVPSVSWEIEQGRPLLSRVTRDRRVWSPSAAKTGAGAALLPRTLRLLCDILFDVLHLLLPTTFIPPHGVAADLF